MFEHDKLNLALFDIEDLFDRALCPFYLLGNTAKDVHEEKYLYGEAIEVGVEKKNLTESVMNILKMYINEDCFTDTGVEYIHDGVPVKVKFIKNKYKFLNNPEKKIYIAEFYNIPNPFADYWKVRKLIK